MTRLRPSRDRAAVGLLLLAGLALRLFFVYRHSFVAGDSLLYQDIALNWLHAHVYGLSTDGAPRPTLIRLPGYPLVLAVLAFAFDQRLQADPGTLRSFLPVLYLQVFVDLATCVLAASLASKLFRRRAGFAALAATALCPFTANYCAVPLTETLTLFTTVLAFWAARRWRERRTFARLTLLGAALGYSILLRPDQALLTLAVLPLLWAVQRGSSLRLRCKPLVVCTAMVALPFVPWTVRNAITLHVFQPLAPRLANDPGERVPRGFQHWYRTFGVDFASTEDAYWNYPEQPVDPGDLPNRAFDSAGQRSETYLLLHEAAAYNRLQPAIDARFEALAQQRVHANPLRYYVALPVARLMDMLLRPRVEMLPVAERWWQFRLYPGQALFALLYAGLNLALLIAACAALPRAWRLNPSMTAAICGYMLLRCALLLTLDNAEQRYTLEFIPLWILLGSALLAGPFGTVRNA